jgi:hypothetical protein
VHLPTNSRYIAYPGNPRLQLTNRGRLRSVLPNDDDYDIQEIDAFAVRLLEGRPSLGKPWVCPLCGQTVIVGPDGPRMRPKYYETCKLTNHMIGNECLAYRDFEGAKRLIAENRQLFC